jgi:hypothetical protein
MPILRPREARKPLEARGQGFTPTLCRRPQLSELSLEN